MLFVCPVCGEQLEDVFWDGEQWLWSTADDMIPCFLDESGDLYAIGLPDEPYVPSEVIKVHCHGYCEKVSKFSFFRWCVIIGVVVVVFLEGGLLRGIQ